MTDTPQIVVTVTAPTTAELRRRRDEVAGADLVELRLDTVCDPDPAGALAGRRHPVIVTCRPTREGGRFAGSEEERRALLERALALGAEFVDLEWRAGFDDLIARVGGRRVVLSAHDGSLPADLPDRLRAMRASGAEIVKIAVATRRLGDCLALRDLAATAGGDRGLVLIGTGEAGLATRVLAGRFGSRWTYAGGLSEVGQVSATDLLSMFRYRSLTPDTALYGVVGMPVAHSVSPAMHNAAFAASGTDAVYLPLAAADADDFVRFARGMRIAGASVTTPFKMAMCERADELDPVALRVGAVNTLRADGGRWVGTNTDVAGFLEPLRERTAIGGLRAAVLGAGGAARAVAVGLASGGARVRVHARRADRAAAIASLAGGETGAWPPERGSWDLLVNCTPVGMYPHADASPVPASALTGATVYDLVYNPATTRLLQDARQAGCRIIDGLEMLVAQARAQFEWWTGHRPEAGLMREAARQRLAEYTRDEDHVV
jgi:3-dehydroquinate dehydratase/shikimate dehydrogenase